MNSNFIGSGIVTFDNCDYDCDLFIDETYGEISIQIIEHDLTTKLFNTETFNFFDHISLIRGELFKDYNFTLLNCYYIKGSEKTTSNKSVKIHTYIAEYILIGKSFEVLEEIKFKSMRFGLSNIIKWGTIKRFIPEESFKVDNNKQIVDTEYKIIRKKSEELILYEDNHITIKYMVCNFDGDIGFGDAFYKEKIILQQNGCIDISFNDSKSISEFTDIMTRIKRLIEISIRRVVSYNKILGIEKDNKEIKIVSRYFSDDSEQSINSQYKDKCINLPELIEHESFKIYLNHYNSFLPVLELYLEAFFSKEKYIIRFFLNATGALEAYYSHFITNDYGKYIDIINNYNNEEFEDSTKAGNWKKYCKRYFKARKIEDNKKYTIPLRGALADLVLIEFKEHILKGEKFYIDFSDVINTNRNHYIHSNEITDKILSTNDLLIYIYFLKYILDLYIFKTLGFNQDELKKKSFNRGTNNPHIKYKDYINKINNG